MRTWVLQVQVTSGRLVITGVALHVYKMVSIKFNENFNKSASVFLQESNF